jgi:phenylacetate-CoA ligase
VFEYLKLDEDLPADPGERARMVVTDLFNRAMPLIRYDTGDVVVRQAAPSCGWRTETLSEVEGRRLDFIYDTRDRLLSPAVVCNHFWPFTRLKQFQFVQEAQGQYRIILNGALGKYEDATFVELAKGFLGADASVSVVHVDQIPQLASGKFMVVISHYRPVP